MSRRAADIFHARRELPVEWREVYLHGACGKDGALRTMVEALLQAHAAAGDRRAPTCTVTRPAAHRAAAAMGC